MRFSHILSWKGTIDNKNFLFWGILLFAIKYNLDRFVALTFFNESWYIFNYLYFADNGGPLTWTEEESKFYLSLVAMSLPFIWFGNVLCVKRLRDTGLPTWCVVFFYIPFINFILFLILCTLPTRNIARSLWPRFTKRMLPKSTQGSAMLAIGIVLVMTLPLTALMVEYFDTYGLSMFIGIPFFLGFGSVLIHGQNHKLTFSQALGISITTVVMFSLVIFMLAIEGIICIVMAFPLMAAIAAFGALVAFMVIDQTKPGIAPLFAPLLLLPLFGYLEQSGNREHKTLSVTSEIVIDAGAQDIWNELVAFSTIEEPTSWMFKTGIAYPTHAEIKGTGVGAVRRCNFTTGTFIEPILIWDEPNRLQFGVSDQPPPMVEWSIYKDLQIEHLDGYFRSTKGEFKLTDLGNGKTLLQGTTWYQHDIWPSSYWALWSDMILHKIHLRVLDHIKAKAEG